MSSDVIFANVDEKPFSASSLSQDHFEICGHPMYTDLAIHCYYLPLQIFLLHSIKRICLEHHTMTKVVSYRAGVAPGTCSKHTILDTFNNQFPAEEELNSADWMEAWHNLLLFWKSITDDKVYMCLASHFDFCHNQQNFRVCTHSLLSKFPKLVSHIITAKLPHHYLLQHRGPQELFRIPNSL